MSDSFKHSSLKMKYLGFFIFKEKQYEPKFWFIRTFFHSNLFPRHSEIGLLVPNG